MQVDVGDLDGVVPVPEAIPGRDFRLDVAGRVGGSGPQGVSAHVVGLPGEGPVLPVVRPPGWFELGVGPEVKKSSMYASHGPSKLVTNASRVSSSNSTNLASWIVLIATS
jgi:hypothetical protein